MLCLYSLSLYVSQHESPSSTKNVVIAVLFIVLFVYFFKGREDVLFLWVGNWKSVFFFLIQNFTSAASYLMQHKSLRYCISIYMVCNEHIPSRQDKTSMWRECYKPLDLWGRGDRRKHGPPSTMCLSVQEEKKQMSNKFCVNMNFSTDMYHLPTLSPLSDHRLFCLTMRRVTGYSCCVSAPLIIFFLSFSFSVCMCARMRVLATDILWSLEKKWCYFILLVYVCVLSSDLPHCIWSPPPPTRCDPAVFLAWGGCQMSLLGTELLDKGDNQGRGVEGERKVFVCWYK